MTNQLRKVIEWSQSTGEMAQWVIEGGCEFESPEATWTQRVSTCRWKAEPGEGGRAEKGRRSQERKLATTSITVTTTKESLSQTR